MTRKTQTPVSVPERAAATYVGYSAHYLRVARRLGRGPAYLKIGRTIRYRVSDLDNWLEAHRVNPPNRHTTISQQWR